MTVPKGVAYYHSLNQTTFPRHSIRYVSGTARLTHYEGADLSLCFNPDNAGKSLDEVAGQDDSSLWFPQAWPTLEDDLDKRLEALSGEPLPQALQARDEKRQAFATAMQTLRTGATEGE